MTISEMRKTSDYKKAIDKIRNYSKGFNFDVDFTKVPTQAQKNALFIILVDAQNMGLIESNSFDMDINGSITSENFTRL